MKSWILRMMLGAALRQAIAYAHEIVSVAVDAIIGVLEGGNLPDHYRVRLDLVRQALVAVRDFLARLRQLAGAPDLEDSVPDLQQVGNMQDAVKRLREITQTL